MKKVIFLIALNCFAFFEGKAQGFAHIYQTPLLLNPSFAGSTGGARLAAASNFGKIAGGNMQNNYLSFDNLLQRFGIGIGGAAYTYKNNNSYVVGGNICIAPKYILKRRDGSKRATFSPSVSLGYSGSNVKGYWNHSDTYLRYHSYNSPYDLPYINDYVKFSKDLKLSVGLMYNSEKLILGLVFRNRCITQKYEIYETYIDSTKVQYQSKFINGKSVPDSTQPYFNDYNSRRDGDGSFKATFQTLDFHFSKIVKLGSDKFSLVPSFMLGLAYYDRNEQYYYRRISIYSLNTSIQINYNKVFFGGGLATGINSFYGFAGYKNERIKIMGSYNFLPRAGYQNETRSFEFSINYNLKK